MTHNTILAMLQSPGQTTRDAISHQIRDEVAAARQEALAARKAQISIPAGPGGSPVTIQTIPFDPNQGVPPRVVDLSIAFFVTVAIVLLGLPLMRAFARRLDRSGGAQKIPPEISSQLSQLTQAVDAIAVEVERISEGQRFTTRLLAEQRTEASRTILAPVAGERPLGG